MNEASLLEIVKPVANSINGMLSTLVPRGEIYLVIFFSIVVAYIIKSKNNWSKMGFVILAVTIYGSLRFFGVGG